MPVRLHDQDVDFEFWFEALVKADRSSGNDVRAVVAEVLARVKREGDAALLQYTAVFDDFHAKASELRFSEAEITKAYETTAPDLREALEIAAARIEAFHLQQMPADIHYEDDIGVTLGQRWTPIDTVGLYVPGGTAAYPSSVLMNAVPAKIAGVRRLVMTVPTPGGSLLNPLVLAAARIAGVDEIYRIGGAQAIGALAFGTATIPRVDKIVGPGNAYVAEAKRQVFGQVGIDTITGPSEILVIADGDQNPAWVAADLLSQAEHDDAAQAILITDSVDLADKVDAAVQEQIEALPRQEIAARSWENFGAIIVVSDLAHAVTLANRLAAEHLELLVADPLGMAGDIRHAGSIFLGPHTPEVIGDYVGGPNHVLPTSRSARFSSGLSVHDFMKRSTLLQCGSAAFAKLAAPAAILAHAEGLAGHARAVELRMQKSIAQRG